jgi:hypothetical protein
VEVDSAGASKQRLDIPEAVVRSMAVTPKVIVAVLRRADGRFEGVRMTRGK